MELDEIRKHIQSRINDADMILVGIGNELDTDHMERKEEEIVSESDIRVHMIQESMKKMGGNEAEGNDRGFFDRCFSVYQKRKGSKRNQALLNLKEMLQEKNYFVISTNVDECLYQTGFRYLVTPCGKEALFQCQENCCNIVWDNEGYVKELFSDEEIKMDIKSIYGKYDPEKRLEILKGEPEQLIPLCPKCGKPAEFNMIRLDRRKYYCEQGYLQEWEKYRKWLSGTLNKKLLLLDLGSDFTHPQLIRWAFERTTLLNQKSFLIRVHKSLSNIPEEIKDRAEAIPVSSKDLFE